MEFLNFIDLRLFLLTVHIFSIIVAAGSAMFGDYIFLSSIKDGKISKDEFRILKHVGVIVWTGLFFVIPSGAGLFMLSSYLLGGTFLAKMTILAILLINAVVFHVYHIPAMTKMVGKQVFPNRGEENKDRYLFVSGVVSAVSWIFIIILGATLRVPYGYEFILFFYFVSLAIGAAVAGFLGRNLLSQKEKKILRTFAYTTLAIGAIILLFLV